MGSFQILEKERKFVSHLSVQSHITHSSTCPFIPSTYPQSSIYNLLSYSPTQLSSHHPCAAYQFPTHPYIPPVSSHLPICPPGWMCTHPCICPSFGPSIHLATYLFIYSPNHLKTTHLSILPPADPSIWNNFPFTHPPQFVIGGCCLLISQ